MLAKNILIIEADAKSTALFSSAFSGTPFQVHFTKNHAEALNESIRLKPLLIIIDATGIKGDGAGVLRQLRQNCVSHNPIVIASLPYGNRALWEKAHSWGVEGFITKPFDPGGLAQRIEKLLPEL